jgi:serine/threonine-protein kinase
VKVCPVCSTEYADDVRFCANDGSTLRAAAPTASLVGQVIADRYHVVKKLGEGGMGQVYLAEHVKMGRRSAIKVMNPAMVHDPDAVARFNREAANASRITHPNVCAVYDFGETPDGVIYLAMEFIEGEPLTDLIEREGALPTPRAVTIFKQTADALQAAHDLGIVHRDLKPDNIMLSKGRDGGDVVKVVDFGIAKAVGGDETGQKVTKTGLVVGTPEFMSPEQLSGDKLDGRSDLYSLALVFFRMLTGQLPFVADSVQETMIKRLTDEPQKLAEVRPELTYPAGLQGVLDQALARTPGERYQSVAKFAEDVLGVARPLRATGPATRQDIEAKTQLLDAQKTKAMAARRAPAKKAAIVPIAVGAIVLVGAGVGAWAMLGNKSQAAGRDTTSQVLSHPESAKTVVPAPDTSKLTNVGRNTGTHRQTTVPPRDGATRSGIDPTKADDILTALIDSPPAIIADSAQAVYNTPGVARSEKAFAACMIAQADRTLGRNADALRWAQIGLTINSSLSSCQDVVQHPSSQP